MKFLKFDGRRLVGIVGAVTTGFGAAQSADAEVVFQDLNANVPPGFPVNFDGDAVKEFDIDGDAVEANIKVVNFAPGLGFIKDPVQIRPDNLAFGTLIGPASTFSPGLTGDAVLNGLDGDSSPIGNFNGSAGYIGVQFLIGANTHYGYLGYEGTQDQKLGRVFKIGYEDTPGMSIQAGSEVSIPEPTSLALLAVGAAGLGLYRRRRPA